MKRFLDSIRPLRPVVVFAALLLCISSSAQKKVTYQRDYRYHSERINGRYIPKDIDEAIDSLDAIISEEEKRFIADSLSLVNFCIDAHFGWGLWIRNEWGLWGGSRLQKFLIKKKVYHPDDMSYEILKAYYKKKIKGMDYSTARDIKSQGSHALLVIKSRFYNLIHGSRKEDVAKAKREFDENGCTKGVTVYFSYPFGCSTAEEQDNRFKKNSLLPEGMITGIDYGQRRIKVKLLSSISPYGIIIFDGDFCPDDDAVFNRDFDSFSPFSPNRFYMKKGDELWFDLADDFWEFEE